MKLIGNLKKRVEKTASREEAREVIRRAGMLLTGKRPEMSGKAIMMTSMVETYAILAFVISFIATFLGVNLG